MSLCQKWKKIGRIFCPSGERDWLQSHASVPIAENLEGNIYKIYFSSRDRFNRSYTSYLIIDIEHPFRILDLSSSPVLEPGKLGTFDDSGAMATWLVKRNYNDFLYYIGWNLGVTVPFRNSVGLAVRKSDKMFQRYSEGPLVDRSIHEPYFCASCCVLEDCGIWRMWYLSCTGWFISKGKPEHRYHIKYAESLDGINWERNGIIAIDYSNKKEYAISRPSVIKGKQNWSMWYSYRGTSYRIGYAESNNGIQWERMDQHVGIDVSTTGWDSKMIEYPYVFEHNSQRYMLYNGNGYGKTGFGIAVLEKD